jgi:hypothetical protein
MDGTEERLSQFRDAKASVCKTEQEGNDFDKLMVGALACACPNAYWMSALDVATMGLAVMRQSNGDVNRALAEMLKLKTTRGN